MTSMFGLVLAIGIVVDDAIVVVEAVQHKIDHGMSPRDATIQAMEEVSGPVVAIALILAAVFIPVAFLGGITGQIYRQFALTIAVSVLLSAFNALTLSPALSALILKPKTVRARMARTRLRRLQPRLRVDHESLSLRREAAGSPERLRAGGAGGLLSPRRRRCSGRAPAGFLPDEDQGVVFVAVRLPDGASLERTDRVVGQVEDDPAIDTRRRSGDDARRPRPLTQHQQLERRDGDRAAQAVGGAAGAPTSTAIDPAGAAAAVRAAARARSSSASACRRFSASAPPAGSSSCCRIAATASIDAPVAR